MPRRPRVVLAQAPVFSGPGPINALALLSAHLKDAGVFPIVHDASLNARRGLAGAGDRTPPFFEYPDDFLHAIKNPPGLFERLMDQEAAGILAHRPDIVGFSVMAAAEECSLALAERVKEASPGTLIVFGGPQCLRETMAFDLIQSHAVDAVALGEADRSFVDFARAWDAADGNAPKVAGFLAKERGRVVDCGDPPEWEDLDALPFLDFSGFDISAYDGNLYLVGSRGCVRKCAFCTHILQEKVYRRMSAERIAAEIRHQFKYYARSWHIEFGDSLINGDVRRLARLSELMVQMRLDRAVLGERRDLSWGGMAIIHPTMTPELLKRMRQAGCASLRYGLESGSQSVIDAMRKNFRVEDASRVIRDTKAAGIRVVLFLLVGFPGETEEDFRRTETFLERHANVVDGVVLSWCEIQKGSHVDAHPGLYGVRTPLLDRKRWTTVDGSNTFEVRSRRFARLSESAQRLGIGLNEKSPAFSA